MRIQKERYEISENEIMEVADLLHDKLCRWNHTDGCGWFYESWEKRGYSRSEYYAMAERVLTNNFSKGDIELFFNLIKR